MKRLLEIAVFSEESASVAIEYGADRLELCTDYRAGGISPKLDLVKRVRKLFQGPLHVIVRPRGGDFFYTTAEVSVMQEYILSCKQLQVDGFVLGALTASEKIDWAVCEVLRQAAGDLTCTFHRAFDRLADKRAALQELITNGFEKVLTSGGAPTALEGLSVLTELQLEFGKSITLMPGGGIRSFNAKKLLETGCQEFHSAACGVIPGEVDSDELKMLRKIFNK